ncbi:MAG: NTP transferase domain-containing protein [Phycisphaerae bacterium]
MAPVDPAATLPPLCAGLLVGGASTRMGRDKPLIVHAGAPLLARVCAAVTPHCRTVVLLGNHAVAGFEALPRIADAPNLAGPAAGMLAAARHDPAAAWLIVSCDLPLICADAVAWLRRRAGGRTAARCRVASQVEPLQDL